MLPSRNISWLLFGYDRAILERGGKVIGLDQDGEALQQCKNNLLPFIQSKQLEVHHANFCQLGEVLAASEMLRVQESCSPSSLNGKSHDSVKNALKVHGIFLDLGVSSHQIDDPTRCVMCGLYDESCYFFFGDVCYLYPFGVR